MAITLKLDPEQLQSIVDAVNSLSDNLGKWQAQEIAVIDQGFTDLVETLGGSRSEDVQARINQVADTVRAVKDRLQTSIDAQQEGDE